MPKFERTSKGIYIPNCHDLEGGRNKFQTAAIRMARKEFLLQKAAAIWMVAEGIYNSN
jgi:hypothetical protein